MMMPASPPCSRLAVTVYSDYLCPWCWPAVARLRQLESEHTGRIIVERRAFPLLPHERKQRFTTYHLQHRRAARQMTGLPFHQPEVGAVYPSSSFPALEAAKWVAARYPEQVAAFDLSLFEAFFAETRDISSPQVLADLTARHGLPVDELHHALATQTYREAVWSDYRAALASNIHSIPTVIIGQDTIQGAVPYEEYARIIRAQLLEEKPHQDDAQNGSLLKR